MGKSMAVSIGCKYIYGKDGKLLLRPWFIPMLTSQALTFQNSVYICTFVQNGPVPVTPHLKPVEFDCRHYIILYAGTFPGK